MKKNNFVLTIMKGPIRMQNQECLDVLPYLCHICFVAWTAFYSLIFIIHFYCTFMCGVVSKENQAIIIAVIVPMKLIQAVFLFDNCILHSISFPISHSE